MLTVEALRSRGVAVEEGMARCLNNEAFYLRLVGMAFAEDKIAPLEQAIAAHDLEKGFEAAHALKGMFANLSLTPVLNPVLEITELLRSRTETDYAPLVAKIREEYDAIKAFI